MKRLMTMIAVAAVAVAAFSDEAFDHLKTLSWTPKEEYTPTNIESILDAAVAVTNTVAIGNIAQSKLVSQEALLAKVIDKPAFYTEWIWLCETPTTNMALFAQVNAAYKSLTDDYPWNPNRIKANLTLPVSQWLRSDQKRYANDINDALDAGNKMKYACFFAYMWHMQKSKPAWYIQDIDSDLEAAYRRVVDVAFEKARSGTLPPNVYRNAINKAELFEKPNVVKEKFFNLSMTDYGNENVSYWSVRLAEDRTGNGSAIRNKVIAKVASKDEVYALRLGKIEDKFIGNNNFTAQKVWPCLNKSQSKITAALYLNDADKVIETFITCDDNMAPKQIEDGLLVLNALNPNYKVADVVTALKAVNQRYTLKLYDDRDTWEPVLSKIRALIDIKMN